MDYLAHFLDYVEYKKTLSGSLQRHFAVIESAVML